jgi:hypothetical protein
VQSPGPPLHNIGGFYHHPNHDQTPPASDHLQDVLDTSLGAQIGDNDVVEQSQQRTSMIPNWESETYSGGARLFPRSERLPRAVEIDPALLGVPTPTNTSIVEANNCRDFIMKTRQGIKLNAGQQHEAYMSTLITNVELAGYKLQGTPKGNLSGLYALQKGIARHTSTTPTFEELSNLVFHAGFDLNGRSLPAQALWGVLELYGTQSNISYRLGVVTGGCADPDSYDIYIYENDEHQRGSQPRMIWLYNDNAENAISVGPRRWSAMNHWSAIAPDIDRNAAPRSWAAVAAKPAPPSQHRPTTHHHIQPPTINTSLLHPGRAMNMTIRPKPTDPQPEETKRSTNPRNGPSGKKSQRRTPAKPTGNTDDSYDCATCGTSCNSLPQLQ